MKLFFLLIAQMALVFEMQAQAVSDTTHTNKKYTAIPSVKLVKTDGTNVIFRNLLHKTKPTVVLLFSPECDHCQQQTQEIVSHINELNNINFILVSNKPVAMLKEFAKKYGTNKCKNILMAQDAGNQLSRYYDVGGYPSMLVLNKSGVLVDRYITSIVNKSAILFSVKKN